MPIPPRMLDPCPSGTKFWVAEWFGVGQDHWVMNRSQIEGAIERNVPFILNMADGKQYRVPHRDYISLPPAGAFVVVYDDQEHVFVLPLLTMTGLSYQSAEAGSKELAAS